MKQTILILALGVLTACGSSPTGPTPTVTPPPPQTSAEPPPAPTPPARTILHASVASSHWFPGAAFTLPDSFDVVIEGETAKISTLDPFPFGYHASNEDFIVKQKDFEFVVQGGRFTFNGLAGQAAGSIGVAK